jgi:predicted nucleotidyltransferase
MNIYIFGSRGPNNCFKPDSDVDVVVVETGEDESPDFKNLKEKFKAFALENSEKRAGLDLFKCRPTVKGVPILESVYDFGDRSISFSDMQEFQKFRKTWKAISEADLMMTVIAARDNCP